MRRLLTALALLVCAAPAARAADEPIDVLIVTGAHRGHEWQATTDVLLEILGDEDRYNVDVTTEPAKDLTAENLAKYDVLLLNYRENPDTTESTTWTDANKQALVEAVKGGKGLFVYHFAASAFLDWPEYETMIGGGWRDQGFHGPPHEFTVKTTDADHPVTRGLPSEFAHTRDELYQNSKMVDGNVVLATAYSDPEKPRGTGKDEPVLWVNQYGEGRVFHEALGHDTGALSNPNLQEIVRRGVEWAATGDVSGAEGE